MEDRNKTIHSERLFQRKPFDGNYPHSFNDLFLRVYNGLLYCVFFTKLHFLLN